MLWSQPLKVLKCLPPYPSPPPPPRPRSQSGFLNPSDFMTLSERGLLVTDAGVCSHGPQFGEGREAGRGLRLICALRLEKELTA